MADVAAARAEAARLADAWQTSVRPTRLRTTALPRACRPPMRPSRRANRRPKRPPTASVSVSKPSRRATRSACASRRSSGDDVSNSWFRSKKNGDRCCRSSERARGERLAERFARRSPRAGSGTRWAPRSPRRASSSMRSSPKPSRCQPIRTAAMAAGGRWQSLEPRGTRPDRSARRGVPSGNDLVGAARRRGGDHGGASGRADRPRPTRPRKKRTRRCSRSCSGWSSARGGRPKPTPSRCAKASA